MTEAATLERGLIVPVAEFPSVVAADARRQELSTAHETAQRELARVTIDRSDAQRLYRGLSAAMARGELTAESHEWLDAKDQLRQLDERHGKASLEVDQLRRTLDDCQIAGRAIRAEATREREQQIRQQTTELAAEMVSLLERLSGLNSELIARIKIVGFVGRVTGALDPQFLRSFIHQLGGSPQKKPTSNSAHVQTLPPTRPASAGK